MPRPPRSEKEIEQGRALGGELQSARGSRTSADVAQAAGVPIDTLRKVERGAVASPGFFVIASIAREVGLDLDHLVSAVEQRAEFRP